MRFSKAAGVALAGDALVGYAILGVGESLTTWCAEKKYIYSRKGKASMYGTVARMRVKPGKAAEFSALSKSFEQLQIPGYVGQYVYRMDADPNEVYLVVLFTDKAAYQRNADSPEQSTRFQQMMALLDGEPAWHDGEVIYSTH